MVMSTSPESLVHRYEAGERDPALIRELNRLAWEGFHDPWEPGPKAFLKEDGMHEEIDPNVVQPISVALIERYLQVQDLRAFKGRGDCYLVQFAYDADLGREVRLYLGLEGDESELLVLKITGDRRVEGPQCPKAVSFCNRWNGDHRWPKAYLEVPEAGDSQEEAGGVLGEDASDHSSGTLVLEAQWDFSAGIHQALFDDLITSNIQASLEFWRRAQGQGF